MTAAAVIRFLAGAGFAAAAVVGAAQTFVVPPELWDRPRSGRAVIDQPAVRQAVGACLAQPGSRLLIRHGVGQESLLAAEELRTWLEALAVEPALIALRNDLPPAEPLRLEVIRD
ncbi:hypothetical protein D3C83_45760 [compost metagenome]